MREHLTSGLKTTRVCTKRLPPPEPRQISSDKAQLPSPYLILVVKGGDSGYTSMSCCATELRWLDHLETRAADSTGGHEDSHPHPNPTSYQTHTHYFVISVDSLNVIKQEPKIQLRCSFTYC